MIGFERVRTITVKIVFRMKIRNKLNRGIGKLNAFRVAVWENYGGKSFGFGKFR